jgi:phage/plasmid-like protein (TIGR03299 family)
MSHEIDMSNGRENMAYTGEAPWHKLGVQLEPDSPLEIWATQAGFDWTILQTPCMFNAAQQTALDQVRIVPDKHVLYRSDTQVPLAVVGDRYVPVQPKEVIEWFRDLIACSGYKMETAGMLFGGRRFWAMAKNGKTEEVRKGDPVRPYLFLYTSCDGSSASVAATTAVRVVCNNTVQMAMSTLSDKTSVSRRHTINADLNGMKDALGIAPETYAAFIERMRKLASVQVTAATNEEIVKSLFAANVDPKDMSTRKENIVANVLGHIADSPGTNGNRSAWDTFNGITYYVDHVQGRADDTRFQSAMLGKGNTLKQKALYTIEELCGIAA